MAAGKYDGSIRINTKIDQSGFNSGRKQIENGLSGITKSLKGVAAAAGIAFGTAAIINFSKTSIKASTDLSNALLGLKSIMDGQGRSFADAQKFINSYISDGLIPATQAITAYKNLALRGYDDSQIQKVLIALKDSAAFGRQASYTMGEAVQTASEGLKNENSILVDNAGVTKNVAQMWEDYAKSIGTNAQALTKQQKIQAEVNGILEESRYQVGDAAKVANTYSGEILKLGFNFNNLKIAIGNALIPIAQAVLPSINAMISGFTRLANVFAQVSTAIFGKHAQAQNDVAASGAAAAKSENNLAKAATAAGKATEKAGKKAEGALAGFDELNVLAKDTASSMGSAADVMGGAALTPTSGEASGEIGGNITVSPAIQTAVDTMMRLLEPLRNINFDNLTKSFDGLRAALEPITQALFAGLKWAYDNIFIPLAHWTIENALPVFLDLLSGALGILSGVINALMPLGVWLWDNFLEPIATWTGGVIISVLGLIADALGKISDWAQKHQTTIQVMTGIVLGFMAAWKAVEIMSFIQTSGGLIAAISNITAAIQAGTIAKLADKAETMALQAMYAGDFIKSLGSIIVKKAEELAAWVASTAAKTADKIETLALQALYAKDFIVSLAAVIASKGRELTAFIASTGAKAADTIATTAATVATIAATTATTALSTALAFLAANPIVLIIAAIAALVIGIVLLITHWDTVKAKAIEVWGAITEVWGKASSWFDNNVLSPIQNAFKGAINFLVGLAEGFVNGFIRGINAIISALDSIEIDVPKGVPFIGGTKFGINIPHVKEISIPRLATGAVIPPNSEFLAVLGDQKHGRNLEAPEGLIEEIVTRAVSNAVANLPVGNVVINAKGNASQIIRYFSFEIDKDKSRRGPSLVKG